MPRPMIEPLDNDEDDLSVIFDGLEDPRIDRKKLYPISEIFFLTLTGVMAGANGWRTIKVFGEVRLEWLRQFMPFTNGIPSHQTIGRVFSLLSPSTLEVAFIQFMSAVLKKSPEQIVALDGKTLRGSFDKASKKAPIHILHAWAVNNGLCIGQLMVDDKSNEIISVPQMIDLLKLSNATFTVDALNTQKNTLKKVIETGNHTVMAVKGNQKNLQAEIQHIFANKKVEESNKLEDVDKGHGRIDSRSYAVISASGTMLEKDWPGIKSIGMATTESTKEDKTTKETRFFIITFPPNVEHFANCVRGHWGIENKLHWVLDVTFQEDHSRVRKDHAPRNMSLIRKIAANFLRKDKNDKRSLNIKKMIAGLDPDFQTKILKENGF